MKLLVLNYEYPPLGGGAASVCRQLCEVFVLQGHDVEIITMGCNTLPESEVQKGVKVTRVHALRTKRATCDTHELFSYVISALPLLIRRLRRNDYDLIHSHFVVPTGLLSYLATCFRRVPYVITAHGSDIPGFNPDRFKLEHQFTPPLLRLIMRKAAGLTTPSLFLRNQIINTCGPFPVRHIPNGINISRFKIGPKQRRILMTGRFLPRKGFHNVLKALQGIDTDFEVHIAGDGPIREELRALAGTLNVKVVFYGWLNQDSRLLKSLYESSAIFCLPSERENASMSLLEAMLAGTAVVTSNTWGCLETVGETGFVVPPQNVPALRAVLQQLLASEDVCLEYGRRARARVEERFNLEKLGEAYLKMFESIRTSRICT